VQVLDHVLLPAAEVDEGAVLPHAPGAADLDAVDGHVQRAGLEGRRGGADRGEDRSLVDLTPREVHVVVDLHAGDQAATVWTNDLTHDYVHENSAYSS
jgi:glutamate N-acetyltransferase/amino-acid N-acetyltransferase